MARTEFCHQAALSEPCRETRDSTKVMVQRRGIAYTSALVCSCRLTRAHASIVIFSNFNLLHSVFPGRSILVIIFHHPSCSAAAWLTPNVPILERPQWHFRDFRTDIQLLRMFSRTLQPRERISRRVMPYHAQPSVRSSQRTNILLYSELVLFLQKLQCSCPAPVCHDLFTLVTVC